MSIPIPIPLPIPLLADAAPLFQGWIFRLLGVRPTLFATVVYDLALWPRSLSGWCRPSRCSGSGGSGRWRGTSRAGSGPTASGRSGCSSRSPTAIKLLLKEDLRPSDADPLLFRLAPYLAFAPVFAAFLALPFGPELTFEPRLNVGVFWILAILSVEVMGVILAGWASNNKWSVYGAMREACQMVSYEIPLGLSIIVGVMTAGTLNLVAPRPPAGRRAAHLADLPQPVRLPRRSSSTSSPAWPATSGPPSTCRSRSRSWWPATTPSTAACGSASSSSPSTRPCSSIGGIQTALFLGGWNDPFGLIGYDYTQLMRRPGRTTTAGLLLREPGRGGDLRRASAWRSSSCRCGCAGRCPGRGSTRCCTPA